MEMASSTWSLAVRDRSSVGLGDGTGNFAAPSNSSSIATTFGPIVGDFNGDGKADFVVSDNSQVLLFISNGDGTFAKSVLPYDLHLTGRPCGGRLEWRWLPRPDHRE